MTCREILDFLDDFLNGALSAGQHALFLEHLAVCPDCVNYLDSYQATIGLTRAAYLPEDEPVLATVPDDLVQAILAARLGGGYGAGL
jgi:predicted anti-sigma-YlaC factor YlaD